MSNVRISREAIVRMLRERGLDDRATEADDRLPTVVETENDLGLLSEFGVAADDLAGGLGEVAPDEGQAASDEGEAAPDGSDRGPDPDPQDRKADEQADEQRDNRAG